MKIKCILISVLILFLLQIIIVSVSIPFLGKFLAKNDPVNGQVLIVEGWIPTYMYMEVKKIIDNADYGKVICVGAEFPEVKTYRHSESASEYSAYYLRYLGVPDSLLEVVTTPYYAKERTYNSANAAIRLLNTEHGNVRSFDVVTSGVHSRRSWILFNKAAKKKFDIGVISLTPEDYLIEKWWTNSVGFRTVINEYLAYIYVKVIFRP